MPIAAIDMGSNSFRLEIGQLHSGRYKRIAYLKETVRLGAGLDGNGFLTEEAAQRGLECLQGFAQQLQHFDPSRVRAVATQTLREARNRDAFLERAQAALGFPIEVISGREEARLIYGGVARLQASPAKRLVIDIGGRSTELILGQGRQVHAAESFQVGSVSLSMRFFANGQFTPQAFHEAQVAAGAEFEEGLELFARHLWVQALGSSGTAGAVSQVLAANGVTNGDITPDGLRWCIKQCLNAGHVSRLNLAGLKEERGEVLAGGLSILYTLAMHFGIERLQSAKGALRQGVIFELDERLQAQHASGKKTGSSSEHSPHDLREASVAAMQRRFSVDINQAQRVQELALNLFASVVPDAPHELRQELAWAAALHEVGMMISHHDYHRHSSYVVAHADVAGFSQSQLRRIADLILGQRGGLRKLEPRLSEESFQWQLLCLRLAAIKCHARGAIDRTALDLQCQGKRALLVCTSDLPRTLYLLKLECEAWERGGSIELVLQS